MLEGLFKLLLIRFNQRLLQTSAGAPSSEGAKP
jgi:hypothetical protein